MMEEYETLVHDTISTVCGVHEPQVHTHPTRAKRDHSGKGTRIHTGRVDISLTPSYLCALGAPLAKPSERVFASTSRYEVLKPKLAGHLSGGSTFEPQVQKSHARGHSGGQAAPRAVVCAILSRSSHNFRPSS